MKIGLLFVVQKGLKWYELGLKSFKVVEIDIIGLKKGFKGWESSQKRPKLV